MPSNAPELHEIPHRGAEKGLAGFALATVFASLATKLCLVPGRFPPPPALLEPSPRVGVVQPAAYSPEEEVASSHHCAPSQPASQPHGRGGAHKEGCPREQDVGASTRWQGRASVSLPLPAAPPPHGCRTDEKDKLGLSAQASILDRVPLPLPPPRFALRESPFWLPGGVLLPSAPGCRAHWAWEPLDRFSKRATCGTRCPFRSRIQRGRSQQTVLTPEPESSRGMQT